jgi:probable DNA metabolism protein
MKAAVLYDGTFDGLLSAIFDVYEYRIADPFIQPASAANGSLFTTPHHVVTDMVKSKRVHKGLERIVGPHSFRKIYHAFLSEITDIENVIFRYAQYAFRVKTVIGDDYSHPDVLTITKTDQKVRRERHRMEAFIRFQKTADDLFYAVISPDFNVLPLLVKHFQDRYADQRWLIYDVRRKEGIFYNKEIVERVEIDFSESAHNGKDIVVLHDEKEALYQQLWQQYFSSVNIAARRNMKLHIRHMPLRYWRYLTEKK